MPRNLTPDNAAALAEAGAALARAFADDPFFCFMLDDPATRGRVLDAFLTANLRLTAAAGGTRVSDADDGGIAAAMAAVLPESPPGAAAALRFGLAVALGPRPWLPRPRRRLRALGYVRAWNRLHATIREPHAYLMTIGVDPAHQGAGHGGRLIAELLRDADARGIGTYLETQNEANVAYYRRFGFVERDRVRPHAEGPPVVTMWRAAAT